MSGDSMAGSKKSVRFNEVVLRQVYRSNSSILGQKHKNQKKAEQKRRKAGRRASEGDKPDSDSKTSFSPDESEDCYQDQVKHFDENSVEKFPFKKSQVYQINLVCLRSCSTWRPFCNIMPGVFMKHFFISNFQKEKTNTFTLLIILIVKSLHIEIHSTNLLL